MNKASIAATVFRPFLVSVCFLLAMPGDSSAQTGENIYSTYCAGCHGAQMQGSVAPALIKKDWKHGGDRNSILNTIRNGIPKTEMIQWEGTLSSAQIEAVTDYILKAQTNPEIVRKNELPLKVKTKLYSLKIEKLVTEGLKGPWGLEFVDASHALITGKFGDLYWMVNGKLDNQPITDLPKTYAYDNVGGLMDLALDPAYAQNGWIYLAFSHNSKNSPDKTTPGMTKVVRGKIKAHQWVDEQSLFQVADSLQVTGGTRWGCRFLFDKQGYLYFTIGDMNRAQDSQILSRPSGKVYRINSDGSIPKDNPLYGKEGDLQAIYSWGNRNVQGLAQHPVTGSIYASEHGPQGGDELNILKKGANYGWPVITYGIDYNGSIISRETCKEGMEQPITYWTPSIAVCPIEFITNPTFGKWANNLLVGALKFEEIRRLVIDHDKVIEQEILLKGYGRIRDLKMGPDGALYVLTNSPDAVLRIIPQ
ncbi:PQQ-dependent sugar dehydrogenase [Spirosoma foliorum]|uniref:PQQ-dependent sugar dehydrogenase n=1 Tax=Spirosoma foliorum TaxID=2710596 RepID=A0A7G5GZ77_9BACT|nr:PQQ-dependent sugar dehydrogenase [Spirosoma foliorum]QMW04169.1 PQQ-dependent sugar dehydrogenase [Spirosoma foliorum]